MQSPKDMKLYERVDRIRADLRAAGIGDDAPLSVVELAAHDQYHYHGTDAVDEAATALALGPSSRVLDVGAGIGGPARWLAATTGCHVTALELQADLDELGRELTRRTGLADRVRHVQGDVLAGVPGGPYDALVSYLAILHIPDRARLFGILHDALRPGGAVYIEDFTLRSQPASAQAEALRTKVQCPYVPAPDAYAGHLADAGFVAVDLEDRTGSWTAFTAGRLAAFRARRAELVARHGAAVVDGLDDFYATVAALYADGVLGGARIVARRAGAA